MPAKRNTNAAGKRVAQERVRLSLSLSEGNGLLPLLVQRMEALGEEPTEECMKQYVIDWFNTSLKEELMKDQRLSVQVSFASKGETCTTSDVAFGTTEAQSTRDKMIARLKAEGCTIISSKIVPDHANYGR